MSKPVTWERRHEAFKAIHDAIAKALGGQVFQSVYPTWCEVQTLIAYKDELVLCIGGGAGDLPGIWITKDGDTWEKKYNKAPSDWWASQIFNDKLYLGGSYGPAFAQITRYDGDFVEVFKQSGGGGAGQGCVEALGFWNGYLYAGRKNEIWRSADGINWTKVYTFATNKSIYQFAVDAGGFIAFEGEPIVAPSRIHRTLNGPDWAEWGPIANVEWFRSNSPSDRIRLGYFCFIGDGKGYVLLRENDVWNSQFLHFFCPEGSNVIAIKCKRIGNYMGISCGVGTGNMPKGQFWIWDGSCLRLVAELPMSIIDFEFFKGNIYLACSSIIRDEWTDEYSPNQLSVFRLPINAIKDAKPAPMLIPLLNNEVINPAGYGAGFIPILGFNDVTVMIFSTQPGILKFQSWDDVDYQWRDVDELPVTANVRMHETVNWRAKFLRLFFTPNAEATVTLQVNLS